MALPGQPWPLLGLKRRRVRANRRASSDRVEITRERCYLENPKELFDQVFYLRRRCKPKLEDFSGIGSTANLRKWTGSDSFGRFVTILKTWFPA